MEWLKKLGAARIACCSPYYFQRIFSYVSGVSK